ncbi:class II aldolase/adducin family protein (plasmid) [Streptomycetaceae bacterium NBC_01309]
MPKPINHTLAARRHSAESADLRRDMAACFRIIDVLGWSEHIFNHVTVRIPGDPKHVLVNPFGVLYSEMRASALVRMSLLESGAHTDSPDISPAAPALHGGIHRSRPDVAAVIHTHSTAGVAVACDYDGLNRNNVYAAQIVDDVAYHEFGGLTVDAAESDRIAASLGEHHLLILRNHGLVAVGASIQEALFRMFTLQRACEVQLAARAGGRLVRPIKDDVIATTGRQFGQLLAFDGWNAPHVFFEALRRRVDRLDPTYRQ